MKINLTCPSCASELKHARFVSGEEAPDDADKYIVCKECGAICLLQTNEENKDELVLASKEMLEAVLVEDPTSFAILFSLSVEYASKTPQGQRLIIRIKSN